MELSKMGKTELRAACKAAGISYAKLNNDGMRTALALKDNPKLPPVDAPVTSTAPELKPVKRSKPKDAAPVVKREERNKVKRPSPDTKCGQVWAKCDELHEVGKLDSKTLLAWSDAQGMNRNNTSIELSQWRKFHGLGVKEVKAA